MPTALTASMASIALPGPTGRPAARKARANCMMFSERRLAAGAAATIRVIARAERALETPPPAWGRSRRGKPRFGVRQSSLASPTPTRPQDGGGGMTTLDCAHAIALKGPSCHLAPCGGHLRAHFIEDLGGFRAADARDVVLVFEQGTERMIDRIGRQRHLVELHQRI